jgi:hypothetical protein
MLLNERKHSYRELYKRKTASFILLFIKDREAKASDYCTLNAKAGSAKNNTMQVVHAKMIADTLVEHCTQWKEISYHNYEPHKNEIREALKVISTSQLTLL